MTADEMMDILLEAMEEEGKRLIIELANGMETVETEDNGVIYDAD